jgi:hypothetical protein
LCSRDSVARRVELGRKLANLVTDPALKKQILEACDRLERGMPDLAAATRQALQNPKDEAAQKKSGLFVTAN